MELFISDEFDESNEFMGSKGIGFGLSSTGFELVSFYGLEMFKLVELSSWTLEELDAAELFIWNVLLSV